MIWGLITVFLNACDEIFRQKSLNNTKDVNKSIFNFMGFFGGLLLIVFLLPFGIFDMREFFNIFFQKPIASLLVVVIVVLNMITSPLQQIVYKTQKISSILPYEKISPLLVIIVSYFWLGGTSLFSFLVTIGLLILLVSAGIDFKDFKSPKGKGLLFLVQLLDVLENFITIYLLKIISESFYYISYVFLGFIIIFFFVVVYYGFRSFKPMIKQNKPFYINRFGSSFSGYGSWLISLFLITEFGPIITFLFGFLSVGATLLMSYLFQGDKPEKKDIILAIIVTLLVGLAYYFK